jgi:hypothetical protein
LQDASWTLACIDSAAASSILSAPTFCVASTGPISTRRYLGVSAAAKVTFLG